jgi:hypothetical protein
MPLQKTLQLNLAWSCLLAAAFACLFALGPSIARAALALASFAFIGVSVMAARRRRWAVCAVILVATVLLIQHLPPVVLNAWLFLTRDSLYLDSPGTILVVAVSAVIFALPALLLVVTYACRWRDVHALLSSG